MFVPDDADKRSFKELSPAAGALYRFYCQWRDHKTGYCRKKFEDGRADREMTRATAYRAHKELLDGFWILETAEGRIGLGGGDFSPVDQTSEARRVWTFLRDRKAEDERVKNGGKASLKIETLPADESQNQDGNLNFETENLKNETENLKIETAHIKDRARVSSSSSSILSSTHTPQQGPPPAGVCVCERPSLERLERYAANQRDHVGRTLGVGWIKTARRAEGEELADLVARLERWEREQDGTLAPAQDQSAGQAALDPRDCPDCHGGGWYYPEGFEKGTAKCRHPRLGQSGPSAPEGSDKSAAELDELCATVEALVEAQGRSPDEVIAELGVSLGARVQLCERFRAGPAADPESLRAAS